MHIFRKAYARRNFAPVGAAKGLSGRSSLLNRRIAHCRSHCLFRWPSPPRFISPSGSIVALLRYRSHCSFRQPPSPRFTRHRRRFGFGAFGNLRMPSSCIDNAYHDWRDSPGWIMLLLNVLENILAEILQGKLLNLSACGELRHSCVIGVRQCLLVFVEQRPGGDGLVRHIGQLAA